jgi:nucleoside-diphosphate-sugar epimerase
VLDNLLFGGEPIVHLLNESRFEFLKGDLLDETIRKKALDGVDAVVHLAAIVGDPACAKDPDLSRKVNLEGSKKMYDDAVLNGVDRFVFASTCSNYGQMEDPNDMVTEESALTPVSVYAETKVASEKYLLGQKGNSDCAATCLRFSTVYGLSPRIRFDLTVNEFTKELAMGKKLVIFGEQFWRPYCHVVDLARSVLSVLKADKSLVAFDVFNVGDTNENYTKKMLVHEIVKQIPDAEIEYIKKDEDPRDYRVSFEKIRKKLGFEITKKVPEGIRQIKLAVTDGFFTNPDDSKYRNV